MADTAFLSVPTDMMILEASNFTKVKGYPPLLLQILTNIKLCKGFVDINTLSPQPVVYHELWNDPDCLTVLQFAILMGNQDVVQLFLNLGADAE